MSLNPISEIAVDMRKKMEKILSPSPALCIIDAQSNIKYIDKGLEARRDYIQKYVKENFTLIEQGQYSMPLPGTLLGFFKMASNLMFVIHMEAGKIGNLLLYRGLLENYGKIIGEVYSDLQSMEILEKQANLILKLKPKGGITPSPIPTAVALKEELTSSKGEAHVVEASTSQVGPVVPEKPISGYPKLMDRYRSKKFNFMEGIILQYCNGNCTLEEVITKSNYSEREVMEIIDSFQSKGWLVILDRKGIEVKSPEKVEIPPEKKEVAAKFIEKMEEIVETPQAGPGEPTKIFPELLERFRSKKFGFKEGLILQLCNGKHSLEDIAKESNLKEEEVLEVINLYQKRGWLIIHT